MFFTGDGAGTPSDHSSRRSFTSNEDEDESGTDESESGETLHTEDEDSQHSISASLAEDFIALTDENEEDEEEEEEEEEDEEDEEEVEGPSQPSKKRPHRSPPPEDDGPRKHKYLRVVIEDDD